MALLDLLPASLVGILFCKSLVFFVLLLLKFLPVFLLLRVHLFLLFLVFPLLFRVRCVWRRWTLQRRKVIGVDSASRVVVLGRRIVSSCIAGTCISRTAMNGATLSGGNDSATAECVWCGCSCNRRLATIYGRAQLWIGTGFLNVLRLGSSERQTPGMRSLLFLRGRTSINSTVSTVVTNASNIAFVDYGGVVHFVNHSHVHVGDRAVIEKPIAFPTTTFVAVTKISVAVIDPAVKAHDSKRPKAGIKDKATAAPSPIRRSPQIARFRRQNPSPGNPVVVVVIVIPRPKTWSPDVVVAGTDRLFIDRQIRWGESNRNAHRNLSGRCRRVACDQHR